MGAGIDNDDVARGKLHTVQGVIISNHHGEAQAQLGETVRWGEIGAPCDSMKADKCQSTT